MLPLPRPAIRAGAVYYQPPGALHKPCLEHLEFHIWEVKLVPTVVNHTSLYACGTTERASVGIMGPIGVDIRPFKTLAVLIKKHRNTAHPKNAIKIKLGVRECKAMRHNLFLNLDSPRKPSWSPQQPSQLACKGWARICPGTDPLSSGLFVGQSWQQCSCRQFICPNCYMNISCVKTYIKSLCPEPFCTSVLL